MTTLIIHQLSTLKDVNIGYTIEVRNQHPRLNFDRSWKRDLRRMSGFVVSSKLRGESFVRKRVFLECLVIQFMAVESI